MRVGLAGGPWSTAAAGGRRLATRRDRRRGRGGPAGRRRWSRARQRLADQVAVGRRRSAASRTSSIGTQRTSSISSSGGRCSSSSSGHRPPPDLLAAALAVGVVGGGQLDAQPSRDAGLLVDLADRRLLARLAGVELALGQRPVVVVGAGGRPAPRGWPPSGSGRSTTPPAARTSAIGRGRAIAMRVPGPGPAGVRGCRRRRTVGTRRPRPVGAELPRQHVVLEQDVQDLRRAAPAARDPRPGRSPRRDGRGCAASGRPSR